MRSFHVLLGMALLGCASSAPPPRVGTEPAKASSNSQSAPPTTTASIGDACSSGTSRDEAKECQILAHGLCFASEAAACACAGCARDRCTFLESFPPQAACE